MGIKITTDDYGVKVWRSDKFGFPQYAVTIASKTESGEKVTIYRELQFRRGVELANGDEIIIRDGFPTLRTWKNKHTGQENSKEVWFVLDFAYKNQQTQVPVQQTQSSRVFDDLPDTFSAAEDDIPF